MASSIIHIAVANEVNKVLKRKSKDLLIGTIAPDISKHLGKDKMESHFLDSLEEDVPNIERFLAKYRDFLNDDFVLGYYIHLYTDYLWVKYFFSDFYKDGKVYKLDGTVEEINNDDLKKYFYNDYTNLNIRLIDEYELELSMFYEEIPKFQPIIEEIPMDQIQIIVDAAGIIIENTKVHKDYVFNMEMIHHFIDSSVSYILSNLKDIGVL